MHLPKPNALVMGILASLFFATTFVANRLMSLHSGGWIWSAALRFFWMLPFFLLIVLCRKNLSPLLVEIRRMPLQWLLWSMVGFGLFYAPLTFAAAYSPSWLVASTWQVTIIAGLLIAPFIRSTDRGTAPMGIATFLYSGIMLLGITLMHGGAGQSTQMAASWKGTVPVLLAAVAFPLGNRKMMQLTAGRLDVFQRILGMTLCSLPFWMLLGSYEIAVQHRAPGGDQVLQTLLVALCSGVIATALFFAATDKVRTNEKKLAAVEATQAAEVLFALVGEVYLLHAPMPDGYAIAGMLLVVAGMVLHSPKSR